MSRILPSAERSDLPPLSPDSSWRERIHFWFEDVDSTAGRAVDLVVVFLILLVSTIFVVKTYPLDEGLRHLLDKIELGVVIIFMAEYVLRIWSAPHRVRQIFRPYSLVDLIAIVPVFFSGQSYQILRVFRALRVLRLARFLEGRHFFYRRLTTSHVVIIRILYIITAIVFVASGLIFYAEQGVPNSRINTFSDAVYFSIVTMSTVGFGDITPASDFSRVITVLMIVSALVFIPWQFRNLLAAFMQPAAQVGVRCPRCFAERHSEDAIFCRCCGGRLKPEDEA